MSTLAQVQLWGRTIGAVSLEDGAAHAAFQYDPEFANSGIEIAPIEMPLSERIYVFPELAETTFHGLPGLLADSLPDRFGNTLIDAWLAMRGRAPASFNAVERLCYTGPRGMGALEFTPTLGPEPRTAKHIEVDALVRLASAVLAARDGFKANFADEKRKEALEDILRVGTSAGGARAKAVIAWNPNTNEVRSGQVPAGEGFEYWLLKLDGVTGDRDKDLTDPKGFGAIEYAYSQMALAAGIRMTECRLLEEGGRRHFMTRRFDRTEGGQKLHMQSLCGLAHFDFNAPGAYSYEQVFLVMRQLRLPMAEVEEQFRRMLFNVVARNQDDHPKNISFLMDREGAWSLSPAYDMTYSYNPAGTFTAMHQMSIHGKRDDFTEDDLRSCANSALLKRGRAEAIHDEVRAAVERWPEFAAQANLSKNWTDQIQKTFRK